MEEINAKIENFSLGFEYDGRFLEAVVGLNYGGSSQKFCSGCFCDPIKDESGRFVGRDVIGSYGGKFIFNLLKVVGVRTVGDLIGSPVVALVDGGRVIGLRNFIDKTNYFIAKELIGANND